MTVFVDDMEARFGRMIMCHMYGTSLPELHAMATRIGVNVRWFQDRPGFPHYDICKSKRALAVKYGAVQTRYRDLPGHLKELGYKRNKKQ